MYRRLTPILKSVNFTFNGKAYSAQEGESVAAALLAANVSHFRKTPVSESPRSAFCLMGSCFECLVTIDGQSNCQACSTEIKDGMVIERQKGKL
nr:(2Fe-2S)-binding protein [uncultured Cohaesibacter sp.]